jgi:predicted Zn-dependent peptidase
VSIVRPATIVALMLIARVAAAQSTSAFAGFETRVLPNGLKVWFKQAPEFTDVSVSVGVPVGSDADPVGKEQLAHFTEHMLFTDRDGRTEEQIKRALEDRGGIRNGLTTWDRTFYYARVNANHGLFAIEWLHGILAPRTMPAALVDRQRIPVLLEVGAHPRTLGDLLVAKLINPPGLRLPDFWAREFGIRTITSRDYDPWRSVHRITAADLEGFYATHYAPARLTLTIIGNLRPDSVWAVVDRTFGTLPAVQHTQTPPKLVNLDRSRRRITWDFDRDASYSDRYKTYVRSAREHLLLIFVGNLLSRQLNQELRYGERKAVYGVGAFVGRRTPGATLQIVSPRIKGAELPFARASIDSAVERLRTGTIPDTTFVRLRDAIASELRVSANSAEALEDWVSNAFFNRELHTDFPDLPAEFSRLSRAEVVAFTNGLLAPERRIRVVERPAPISAAAVGVIAALLLWLTLRAVRASLLRELPMARLRYVARIRRSLAERLALVGGGGFVVFVAVRLLVYVFQVFNDRLVFGVDNFWLQASVVALQAASVVFLLVASLGLLPVKVLVFEDGFAMKYLAYRSRFTSGDEVEQVSLESFPRLSLLGSGVRVRRRDGRSYFIRSRDPEELHTVLQRMLGIRAGDSPVGAGPARTVVRS